jgi:ArsR family transcriptional regulator, arsenate/arsenite/antimonite-responsive transcriptional repressor
MKTETAVERLAALAQESRLAVFRLLVRRGEDGAAAGEIAERLSIPKPTLSFHLAQLEAAGLLGATRDGRSIRYAVNYEAIAALVAFLYESCCVEGSCPPVDAKPGRGAERRNRLAAAPGAKPNTRNTTRATRS